MRVYTDILICVKCSKTWEPTKDIANITMCPKCKSPDWNTINEITCMFCNHKWAPKKNTFKDKKGKTIQCSHCKKRFYVRVKNKKTLSNGNIKIDYIYLSLKS